MLITLNLIRKKPQRFLVENIGCMFPHVLAHLCSLRWGLWICTTITQDYCVSKKWHAHGSRDKIKIVATVQTFMHSLSHRNMHNEPARNVNDPPVELLSPLSILQTFRQHRLLTDCHPAMLWAHVRLVWEICTQFNCSFSSITIFTVMDYAAYIGRCLCIFLVAIFLDARSEEHTSELQSQR